jgi:hypothetical protein
LVIAMILVIVASIFSLIPVAGSIVASILSLAALYLVYTGWTKIQSGILGEEASPVKAVTMILIGTLLQLCNTVGGGWASALASFFGLYLLLIGFKQLGTYVDEKGKAAVKLLIIAVFIGIGAAVLGLIASIVGLSSGSFGTEAIGTLDYIVAIAFVAAYVVQLLGYLKLRESETIGEIGKSGAMLLLISMIVAAVGSLLAIVPFGGIVTPLFAIAGLILIFFGWVKVQEAFINE